MKPALCFLALLLAVPATAGDDAFLPAWETITGADLARHVEILASDAFEGREPGTPGEEATLEYLVKAFTRMGVAPGNGDSYLQEVPLVETRRDGTPSFSIRDRGEDTSFTFDDDFVAFLGRPAASVALSDLPVVFAGYGITADAFDWNDYQGISAEGAAVILFRGEPTSQEDSTLFAGRMLTVHGLPGTKYDTAAGMGARAAIVIHTEATAGFPWSVMTGGGVGQSQQFLQDDANQEKLELVVHVNEEAGRRLLARADLDLDDLLARAATPGFRGIATPLRASASYAAQRREILSHNVVGRIPGRETNEECVIYTGHWDHVGRNESLDGDQIFNGAVDNATGTAGLLEVAEAFAALPEPPRRTVYIVATTAEEKGLLGSEYLARNPFLPLSRTVAVLNMDALFPFGSFSAMTVTAYGSSEIEDVLAVSAARLGRILQDDSAPEAGAYYRSDHWPWAKRGVPALFAVGGPRNEELVEGHPVLEQFMEYLSNGYHKVADEYDPETWDMAGIEEDVRIFFETGWRLAEDKRYPNWYFGNQFRAKRDGMMAP